MREPAQAVADERFEPDVVLSIARGGVFVAGGLAYALDCKNIHLVNVEFCTGVDTTLVNAGHVSRSTIAVTEAGGLSPGLPGRAGLEAVPEPVTCDVL
ncbi:hypothetical protein ACFVT1_06100 [Streptomyces sp. NPDC057963]|uniref:hypothetical protein n=1 Tax=Streptomyces sp. NPDC057963 TaxID=3346290 RepID=UPI0036E81473